MNDMNDLYSYYLVELPKSETNTQITDIPASFHRTNPYPLDLSSVIQTAGEESIEDLIGAARNHGASYTGQLITVDRSEGKGDIKGFILFPEKHQRIVTKVTNLDKNLGKNYANVQSSNPALPAEELAFKDDVYNGINYEQSARLKADLLEETRASNAEAAVVGGSRYNRTSNFTDYTWTTGTRKLSYRGSIAATSAIVSNDAPTTLRVENNLLVNSVSGDVTYEKDSNIPENAIFLVAKQTSGSKTSYAEFTLLPGQSIPVSDIALLGQSFANKYYVFNSLDYLTANGELAVEGSLGTVTTSVSNDKTSNPGWWLSENGKDHEVPSLIDLEDTLYTASKSLVTYDGSNAKDGVLKIDLETLINFSKSI